MEEPRPEVIVPTGQKSDDVVKLSSKRVRFLSNVLARAIQYMVEVQVVPHPSAKGSYFIQFPVIEEGMPYVEALLSNTPFYLAGLLGEVKRLKQALVQVQDKATEKGPSEKLLFDVEQIAREALKEPDDAVQDQVVITKE
jgi:hypothetical protein